MRGIEEIEALVSVAQLLSESTASDFSLCTREVGGWTLRPELAFYGCPFCRGERRGPVASGLNSHAVLYRCVRCLECNLIYPWPRLTREALEERANSPWLNRYLERELRDTPYWPEFIPFPLKIFRQLAQARVLEVGPGPGQLLDYLKKIGGDPLGVELNRVAIEQIRSRGLPVIEASFDERLVGHPELSREFDAVVFLESVYHLFDLREALGMACRLLKKRGWLILTAFDVDTLPIRYFNEASVGINGLSIPINGSARTYCRLVARMGFDVQQVIRSPGQPLDYLGFTLGSMPNPWIRLGMKILNKGLSEMLRFFRQSRNFVLVAKKR